LRDTFQLLLDGAPGDEIFSVVIGVHEGSCLSPFLFIFFTRDLPGELSVIAEGIGCPLVGGKKICCMVFADDLSVFCFEIPGAQQLVDSSTDYFVRKQLTPNPEKCEFIAFSRQRTPPRLLCNVQGVQPQWQASARYLGLIFESNGKWTRQLQVVIFRSELFSLYLNIVCDDKYCCGYGSKAGRVPFLKVCKPCL
jgi:hypothetical protein